MTKPRGQGKTSCKLCGGAGLIRVFFRWCHRERTFEVIARGREVRCICREYWYLGE